MLLVSLALAVEIPVADVAELRAAVAAAAPGDRIRLAPGTHTLDATLVLAAAGTAEAPIVLDGAGAEVRVNTVEGIKITGPHWQVVGLTMRGVCAEDDDCEHALHIVGAADGTVVRGATLLDFNAQIKGNGEEIDGAYAWPDDVVIEGNELRDTRPRQTGNPVTKLDVVGGRRWRVEANRIADFEKAGGDGVSYGAFLKGNSQDGLFARNLVVCSEAFAGGARVGLSLGGGGTSPDSICEEGTCTPEHQRGVLRNNLVVGCSDVGVYLNEAADTVVVGNTLYATAGIDARFEATTAWLGGNVLDGRIRERDGGTATLGPNWAELELDAVFADPAALDFTLVADPGFVDAAEPVEGWYDDFCGQARDATPDGGAVEYATPAPCDFAVAHPVADGSGDTGDSGGDDTGGGDSGETGDSGDTVDSGETGDAPAAKDGGCGCAGTGGPGRVGVGLVGVGLVGVLTRRRASPRPDPRAPERRRWGCW